LHEHLKMHVKPDTDVIESNSDDLGMNESHESSRRVMHLVSLQARIYVPWAVTATSYWLRVSLSAPGAE
jgi:hypothetical protein